MGLLQRNTQRNLQGNRKEVSELRSSNLSHNWQRLQVKQNNAVKTTTGCLRISDITDLHDETKILLVNKHN